MPQPRSRKLACAGYFLSRRGVQAPPPELETASWSTAYAMFYGSLAAGRSLVVFHNTLKQTRDQFDSYLENRRRGWFVDGQPKPLPDLDRRVFDYWQQRTDVDLWEEVAPWAALAVAKHPKSVLDDLRSLDEQEEPDALVEGTEGQGRWVVSKRIERDPRLRGEALRIHGYSCMACGFNFGAVYGSWGAEYGEVHHRRPFSNQEAVRVTNVRTDLAVLCANCHRMVHRRRGRLLTVAELRKAIDWGALAAWVQAQSPDD